QRKRIYVKNNKKSVFELTLKKENDNIFKVLPIEVTLEDMPMSYEKVTKLKSRMIIGTKQALKAMKNGSISEVYLANDADQHIIQKVEGVANNFNIPCRYVDSKKKLGAACGIDVGASTVAIKSERFNSNLFSRRKGLFF